MSKRKPKPGRIGKWRGWAAFLFFALVGVGLALHTGTGTYSSFGIDQIAAICPVGALETLVTGQAPTWHLLVGLIIAIVAVLLLEGVLRLAVPHALDTEGVAQEEEKCRRRFWHFRLQHRSVLFVHRRMRLGAEGWKRDGLHVDSRHAILGGALISTALFRIPRILPGLPRGAFHRHVHSCVASVPIQ